MTMPAALPNAAKLPGQHNFATNPSIMAMMPKGSVPSTTQNAAAVNGQQPIAQPPVAPPVAAQPNHMLAAAGKYAFTQSQDTEKNAIAHVTPSSSTAPAHKPTFDRTFRKKDTKKQKRTGSDLMNMLAGRNGSAPFQKKRAEAQYPATHTDMKQAASTAESAKKAVESVRTNRDQFRESSPSKFAAVAELMTQRHAEHIKNSQTHIKNSLASPHPTSILRRAHDTGFGSKSANVPVQTLQGLAGDASASSTTQPGAPPVGSPQQPMGINPAPPDPELDMQMDAISQRHGIGEFAPPQIPQTPSPGSHLRDWKLNPPQNPAEDAQFAAQRQQMSQNMTDPTSDFNSPRMMAEFARHLQGQSQQDPATTQAPPIKPWGTIRHQPPSADAMNAQAQGLSEAVNAPLTPPLTPPPKGSFLDTLTRHADPAARERMLREATGQGLPLSERMRATLEPSRSDTGRTYMPSPIAADVMVSDAMGDRDSVGFTPAPAPTGPGGVPSERPLTAPRAPAALPRAQAPAQTLPQLPVATNAKPLPAPEPGRSLGVAAGNAASSAGIAAVPRQAKPSPHAKPRVTAEPDLASAAMPAEPRMSWNINPSTGQPYATAEGRRVAQKRMLAAQNSGVSQPTAADINPGGMAAASGQLGQYAASLKSNPAANVAGYRAPGVPAPRPTGVKAPGPMVAAGKPRIGGASGAAVVKAPSMAGPAAPRLSMAPRTPSPAKPSSPMLAKTSNMMGMMPQQPQPMMQQPMQQQMPMPGQLNQLSPPPVQPQPLAQGYDQMPLEQLEMLLAQSQGDDLDTPDGAIQDMQMDKEVLASTQLLKIDPGLQPSTRSFTIGDFAKAPVAENTDDAWAEIGNFKRKKKNMGQSKIAALISGESPEVQGYIMHCVDNGFSMAQVRVGIAKVAQLDEDLAADLTAGLQKIAGGLSSLGRLGRVGSRVGKFFGKAELAGEAAGSVSRASKTLSQAPDATLPFKPSAPKPTAGANPYNDPGHVFYGGHPGPNPAHLATGARPTTSRVLQPATQPRLQGASGAAGGPPRGPITPGTSSAGGSGMPSGIGGASGGPPQPRWLDRAMGSAGNYASRAVNNPVVQPLRGGVAGGVLGAGVDETAQWATDGQYDGHYGMMIGGLGGAGARIPALTKRVGALIGSDKIPEGVKNLTTLGGNGNLAARGTQMAAGAAGGYAIAEDKIADKIGGAGMRGMADKLTQAGMPIDPSQPLPPQLEAHASQIFDNVVQKKFAEFGIDPEQLPQMLEMAKDPMGAMFSKVNDFLTPITEWMNMFGEPIASMSPVAKAMMMLGGATAIGGVLGGSGTVAAGGGLMTALPMLFSMWQGSGAGGKPAPGGESAAPAAAAPLPNAAAPQTSAAPAPQPLADMPKLPSYHGMAGGRMVS